MNVKLDTKEKFNVLTVLETELSANMTDELNQVLLKFMVAETPHIVLNLSKVVQIAPEIIEKLASLQESYLEKQVSLVVCEIQKPVFEHYKNDDFFELINYAPTESEAWDIVQMEEIERELLNDNETNH